jgi:hypothetical protein
MSVDMPIHDTHAYLHTLVLTANTRLLCPDQSPALEVKHNELPTLLAAQLAERSDHTLLEESGQARNDAGVAASLALAAEQATVLLR